MTLEPDETHPPVAIVTGAGSGVGRATAVRLAAAGYAVVLVGRTPATLQATAGIIADDGRAVPTPRVVPADVGDPEAAADMVRIAAEHFGRVDALANVAGSAPLQPIPQITDDALEQCLAVNFKSVVYLTRAVWPVFVEQGGGVVVNVSSLASLDPFTGFNIYGAAKAGVNTFTKATADEGKRHGIRAYAITPGAIETGMLRALFSEKLIPADQAASPDEVAALIETLMVNPGGHASGAVLPVASPA